MIDIHIDPNLLSADFVYTWVVSWHGFFSFIAVASAVILVGRWAPLKGVDPDAVYSTAIWAIIGGVVGARLFHVVDNWTDIYQHNPGQILNVAAGGIAIWGGIVGGFIGGTIYALMAKHPVGAIADLTAPALLYTQTIGRLGDIVNGEHCAKAADYFLAFMHTHEDSPARNCAEGYQTGSQPVIVFEMAWNILSLAILWKLKDRLRPDGMLFAVYIALYSVGRFAISFLREDRVWALGMQETHYISLLALAIVVPLMAIKGGFTSPTPAIAEGAAPPLRGTRAERRRRSRR